MLDKGRESCALLVIDMQSDFATAHDPSTIKAIIDELQYVGALEEPVVILTFTGFGTLVGGIHEMVERLQNVTLVIHAEKSSNDGANPVIQAMHKAGMSNLERLRVVGVNLNYWESGRDFSNFNVASNVQIVTTDRDQSLIYAIPKVAERGTRSKSTTLNSVGLCNFFSTFVLALLLIVVLIVRRPLIRKTNNGASPPAETIRIK